MMRARRFIGTVLGFGVACSMVLTGCSDGTPLSSEFPAGSMDESSPQELTVWTFLPSNYEGGHEAYDAIVAGFEEQHPNVTVTLTDLPYPSYFDQVRNAVVSRSGPDVITMYGGAQAYSYRTGLFPLEDVLTPDIEEQLMYLPENFSADGHLYMVPTGSYGYTLLANQGVFDEAGLDAAEALASWDSMLAACGVMAEQGIQPMAAGWKDGFLLETYLYMISSQLMDAETLEEWVSGDVPVDSPLFREAVEYILQMRDAGCFGGDESLGRNMFDDTTNQYLAGDVAMGVASTLSTSQWLTGEQPSSHLYALPQVPTSVHDALIDAGAEAGWSVTRWSENPRTAAEFVTYMASEPVQKILWDKASVVPNRKDVQVSPRDPIEEDFLPLLENPENHTGFAGFPLPTLAVIERNAAPLMGGSMTVDEFLERAQAAFARTN